MSFSLLSRQLITTEMRIENLEKKLIKEKECRDNLLAELNKELDERRVQTRDLQAS